MTTTVERFVNQGKTFLAAPLSSVATSLTVRSVPTGCEAPQFRIRIGNELLIVTGVSGTTWTVTRHAEGTTATSHLVDSPVTCVLTAGALEELRNCTSKENFAFPHTGGSTLNGVVFEASARTVVMGFRTVLSTALLGTGHVTVSFSGPGGIIIAAVTIDSSNTVGMMTSLSSPLLELELTTGQQLTVQIVPTGTITAGAIDVFPVWQRLT
jgi:hypothetical protein